MTPSEGSLSFSFNFFCTNSIKNLARLTAALLSTELTRWTLSALSAISSQGRSCEFIPSTSSLASTCGLRNVLSSPKGNLPSSGKNKEEASLLGFTNCLGCLRVFPSGEAGMQEFFIIKSSNVLLF